MQSDTVKLAMDLIQRPSITPDDAGCQLLVCERLDRLGFLVERLDSGNVSNFWARKGTAAPVLTFVGHTDVVPTGNESDWRFPPFAGHIHDGYLHGRGAADMKSSIAAMVTACERIFSTNEQLQGSMSFLITSDEEGVAVEGTKYVIEQLEKRGESIDYCLVGEPTSEKLLGDTVKIGRRGSISGRIKVFGKQGHVAYPHLADNPIHRAGKLITAMSDLDWLDANENFPSTTLQISNIGSGVGADNVIPGELELQFNLRHSPESTVDAIIHRIEVLCESLELDCKIQWGQPSNPYYTQQGEFVELVRSVIHQTLGVEAKTSTSGGTSDGRFIAILGAQVVEFGPLNATIHKVNENVSIDDLDRLSNTYEHIVRQSLINQH